MNSSKNVEEIEREMEEIEETLEEILDDEDIGDDEDGAELEEEQR